MRGIDRALLVVWVLIFAFLSFLFGRTTVQARGRGKPSELCNVWCKPCEAGSRDTR